MARFGPIEFDKSGAWRRQSFLAAAGFELDRAQSRGVPATVLSVEVKGLLGVHFALGEGEADAMAAEAANTLMEAFGDSGLVGRLGPSEFGVYLGGESDFEQMRSLAVQSGESCAGQEDREWRLVFRVGGSAGEGDTHRTVPELLARARADLRRQALAPSRDRQRSRA